MTPMGLKSSIFFLFLILLLGVTSASIEFGYDNELNPRVIMEEPVTAGISNVSGESVNDSTYWQGWTPTTYYDSIKLLFDATYCLLVGCTMQGDIDMNDNQILDAGNIISNENITADTYFGDWNGGNVDGNISVGEQFNSAYDPFNKFYSFNLHTSNATGYDAYEQVGTLAEVTASPLTWGGTQEADFSPLWASDDSRHSPQNSATRTKYPAILMKFLTGESPADALYINVTGEANVNAYTYGYYIWDYDSTAWELLGSAHSTPYNLDTTYSAVINTNAENYIDTDGTVYIMIRAITLGGTLQIRLDYVDVQVGVIGGDVTYENRNFNKPVSVTADSTSAFSVFASDGTEVLKVDTMAKAFGGAGLSIDNDAVIGNNLWTKGTASISETTAPTDDMLTIQKTYTEDLGDGLYESISWNPTDASTGGFSAMEFRANARGEYNWAADSTLYGIRGMFHQSPFGAVGNANTTLVASYFTGANELNFQDGPGGDGVMANKTYAQILKPLELLAYSGTDMGDAWGLLIQAGTQEYGNYAVDKETMLEIEKPTLGDVNYQVVLNGTDAGTGIWFGGIDGRRIYNDGTNLVFNTTTGDAYFTRNVSATGFITRTNLLSSEVTAKDWIKDVEDYKDVKGDIKYDEFLGHTTFEVTDMSKPETTITPTSKIIFNPETGLNETFIGTKEVIIYPYKKLEDGVDLQTEQNVLRQALYDALQKIDDLESRIITLEKVR